MPSDNNSYNHISGIPARLFQFKLQIQTYLNVTFMQCSCDNEHNIVDHVAVCAEVHELAQSLISLEANHKRVRKGRIYLYF